MFRRYIAFSLIVFFFAYAAYLIMTDGGNELKLISFEKLGENIQKKINLFMGSGKIEMTEYEKAQKDAMKALKDAADKESK